MIKNLSVAVLAGLFGVSILGCDSPILNHSDAAPSTSPSSNANKNKDVLLDCPFAFPKARMCASIAWDQPPVESKEGTFKLRFWAKDSGSKNGPYASPAQNVHVKLWMPSMGHGSAPVAVTQSKDQSGMGIPGVYDASSVYFVMSGDWEIHIQLKVQSVLQEEAIVKIHI